jgi:addiction module RelE/StbE family toxin
VVVRYTPEFTKQFKKLHPKIQKNFAPRLGLFLEDNYHPLLRNHELQGKYKNYKSINVTGDVRALYKEHGDEIIVFALIGTHPQLYG